MSFPEPIFELGVIQVKNQGGHANRRLLFPRKKCVVTDYREGAGVDLVLDLHDINWAGFEEQANAGLARNWYWNKKP